MFVFAASTSDYGGRAKTFAIEWGYNFGAFTPSDIHFSGPGYDFTARNVRAHDRWQIVHVYNLFDSVAQYNLRFWYNIDEQWSVAFGLDHMKYVAFNDQTVNLTGHVSPLVSERNAGNYNNTPVHFGQRGDIVNNFEHTNGLNFLDLEFARTFDLYNSPRNIFRLSTRVGGGLGIVVPKSDVTLFDVRLDNEDHIAGAVFSASVGLHLEFVRYLYLDMRVKAGWVSLPDVLTVGSGTASHGFGFAQPIFVLGANIPLGG